MTCAYASEERELEIPADLARLREAREWASCVAQEFGFDEDGCFQVKLAASEAVTNAIIHGSSSPGDTIRLHARREDDRLTFEVLDSGREGSDGDSARHLGDGGRGLDLVSMVMEDVELEHRAEGGVLRFSKRCEAAA